VGDFWWHPAGLGKGMLHWLGKVRLGYNAKIFYQGLLKYTSAKIVYK